MANYKIVVSTTAEKALKNIPNKDCQKILSVIQALSSNPYPSGCRKLSGEDSIFRVRQGNYRIIYDVQDKRLLILVLKIGHRKDIYR